MAADLLLQTPAPADSQLLFAPDVVEVPPGPTDLLFEEPAPAGRTLLFGASAGEVLIDGFIEQATGGRTTQFGAPASASSPAAEPQTGAAAGFAATAFGTPGSTAGAPAAVQGQAAGFAPGALGTATARLVQPAGGFTSTHLGGPSSTAGSPGAHGFSSTAWGQAHAGLVLPAQGSQHTTFGSVIAVGQAVVGTASGFTTTTFGTAASPSAVISAATPLGSPAWAPLLVDDDFSSGGARAWGSVVGTISGGLLNPTTYGWRNDVTRLNIGPDNLLRTSGIFFDLTFTTEARIDGLGNQGIEAWFDQSSALADYGVYFRAERNESGSSSISLVAMDSSGFSGTKYGEVQRSEVRRCFPAGGKHTYRLVSRPGFYEMFEDGVLIASIATNATKQARPFSAGATVATYSLAVDSIELVEYGAVGAGPLVQFGTPAIGQGGVAQGIQAVALGTHHSGATYHPEGEVVTRFGLADVSKNAAGFRTGGVPIPSVPLLAAGIASTLRLGTPGYVAHRASALGPVAKIPRAYRQFDQWGRATAIRAGNRFGNTWSYVRMPQTSMVWAAGVEPASFGVPAVILRATVGVSGLNTVSVGQPTSRQRLATPSLPTTASFGVPTATVKTTAVGTKPTAFGHPGSGQATTAQPVHRPTRFGRPTADIIGTCKARGFVTTRLPRPGCRTGNFRLAAGLSVPARFGVAQATDTNRALHIAPIVRFGRSLRSRRTTC